MLIGIFILLFVIVIYALFCSHYMYKSAKQSEKIIKEISEKYKSEKHISIPPKGGNVAQDD